VQSLSREDHRRYDAALLKLRSEIASAPKESHGREYLVAAASLLGEFLGIRYGIYWLVWMAAFFLLVSIWGYAKRFPRGRRVVIRALAAVTVVAGTYFLTVWKTPPKQPRPKSASVFDSTVAEWRLENQPENLELHDLFLIDFNSVQKNYGAVFVDDAKTISVGYAINVEPALRIKFLSFYVGRQDQRTAEICEALAADYQFVLDKALQLEIEQKVPGDSGTTSTKDAVFSKRIYIYHETYLPAEATVKLTAFYKSRDLSAIFRSIDYLSNKKTEASLLKARRESKQ
jgi:hypothetical protein